jgi:hypothetical protein
MDAVVAMEAKGEVEEAMLVTLAANKELQGPVKALHESQDALMTELNLTKVQLQEVIAKLPQPGSGNAMNWVEKLGKRGSRYDVMTVEMGIQLMSSELSAAQAAYALTVFMMKTHPSLCLASATGFRVKLLSKSGRNPHTRCGDSICIQFQWHHRNCPLSPPPFRLLCLPAPP